VLPHSQGLDPLFTGEWNLYAQNPDSSGHSFGTSQGAGTAILTLLGRFHPQIQSLWLSDMAHHHLAIAFIFLIAGHMYRTNFGIGHSMKDLLDAHIPPGGRLRRPGDFLVHHAIAMGLHTTMLILVKGALDARGSKLMPDKKDFDFVRWPKTRRTCDISAWGAFDLAVFLDVKYHWMGYFILALEAHYGREVIETLAWAHECTHVANLIRWREKSMALSIVQARLLGLAHFSVESWYLSINVFVAPVAMKPLCCWLDPVGRRERTLLILSQYALEAGFLEPGKRGRILYYEGKGWLYGIYESIYYNSLLILRRQDALLTYV
nr:photosystem I P700 apoprotein A2, chloroplastic [Tanacetum cinerariifolium]